MYSTSTIYNFISVALISTLITEFIVDDDFTCCCWPLLPVDPLCIPTPVNPKFDSFLTSDEDAAS